MLCYVNAPHVVIANAPDAQFAAILHDNKVRVAQPGEYVGNLRPLAPARCSRIDIVNATRCGATMGKREVIHQTRTAQRIPLWPENDQTTAPDNTYRKFHEAWSVVFQPSNVN